MYFYVTRIGGIQLNPGPRDQDKEIKSEFSINVPEDFEFVGPSEEPVQFIAPSSMYERVKAQKKYHFCKKRKKVFHCTSSRNISPSPAPNSQISCITEEFQDYNLLIRQPGWTIPLRVMLAI